MGERLAQEAEVTEGDADSLLELVEAAGRDELLGKATPAAAACWGSRYEPDFSCMYSQAWPTVVIFSASSSGISSPVFSSKA